MLWLIWELVAVTDYNPLTSCCLTLSWGLQIKSQQAFFRDVTRDLQQEKQMYNANVTSCNPLKPKIKCTCHAVRWSNCPVSGPHYPWWQGRRYSRHRELVYSDWYCWCSHITYMIAYNYSAIIDTTNLSAGWNMQSIKTERTKMFQCQIPLSVFRTNANTQQSATCSVYWTIQYKFQSQWIMQNEPLTQQLCYMWILPWQMYNNLFLDVGISLARW